MNRLTIPVIITALTTAHADDILITATLRLPAARDDAKLPSITLIHQGESSRAE